MNNGIKTLMVTIFVATLIAGALFMSGCVEPTEEEVTDVNVMMPDVALPLWSPFYCAVDQGYYTDEGFNVTITYTSYGTMDSLKQLAANKVDFGYGGDDGVVIARSQDMPVVAIHKTIHNSLYYIFSNPERNITTPEDLIGKKIATPSAGATVTILTKAVLHKAGLDYNNVEFVFAGAGIIPALVQDQVDAMTGYVPQKVVIENMGHDVNMINTSDYTDLGKIYIFTNEKMIQENPEIVTKFVAATQKGLEYSIAHPEEAIDIYIKFNPDAAKDRDLNLAIWKAMVEEGFDRDINGKPIYHLPSEDDWVEKQNTLYDIGMIDSKTNVSKMFTDEFAKGTI